MTWRFDIEHIPKGYYTETTRFLKDKKITMKIWTSYRVIIATASGTVTLSRWLPKEGNDGDRWEMISKKDKVVAWQPWPEYPE
jgi:hypothetical protein